jgi:hypothetical protein
MEYLFRPPPIVNLTLPNCQKNLSAENLFLHFMIGICISLGKPAGFCQ